MEEETKHALASKCIHLALDDKIFVDESVLIVGADVAWGGISCDTFCCYDRTFFSMNLAVATRMIEAIHISTLSFEVRALKNILCSFHFVAGILARW